jgi:hypothetical protein
LAFEASSKPVKAYSMRELVEMRPPWLTRAVEVPRGSALPSTSSVFRRVCHSWADPAACAVPALEPALQTNAKAGKQCRSSGIIACFQGTQLHPLESSCL